MNKKMAILIFVTIILSNAGYAQISPPQQELVIDRVKKTVVFLSSTWEEPTTLKTPDGQNQQITKSNIGTGFLIIVPVPDVGKDTSGNDLGLYFLVTAKHMIRQTTPENKEGPYAKKVTVFFNRITPVDKSGIYRDKAEVDILDERGDLDWFVDDSDPVADVAIHSVFIDPKNADFFPIPSNLFVSKSFLLEKHVNENDEVLFAGLFTSFSGAYKNYPIVRHGRLALLPGEDVVIDQNKPDKKTQIYLAEITSFGGNSGSPVFLRLGGVRESVTIEIQQAFEYRLLGIMKGYFPADEFKQNTGIAIIVPAYKIDEILSTARMKAFILTQVANDKVSKNDLKTAEAKFKEAIAILNKHAPESSQIVNALKNYASMLQNGKRGDEALVIQERAKKIESKPVSKIPEP